MRLRPGTIPLLVVLAAGGLVAFAVADWGATVAVCSTSGERGPHAVLPGLFFLLLVASLAALVASVVLLVTRTPGTQWWRLPAAVLGGGVLLVGVVVDLLSAIAAPAACGFF